MRIVGGKWAGRELVSPGGRVRPTREEVRDAWLSWLENDLREARVLDLFAGTGALGLEALSRGAATVDFVENGASALHALKANRARFRARKQSRLFKRNAISFVDALGPNAYDLVLADPPYASDAGSRAVRRWLEVPFSRVLSVEHASNRVLPGRARKRVYGDIAVSVYRTRMTSS
jgi:16S rRNA (guanine966-N2)-methyltransferase